MSLPVQQRPRARLDIIETAVYLAESSFNIELAERFLAAVQAAFEQIGEWPQIGSPRDYLDPRLAGIRMWSVPDFPKILIFYRLDSDRVEIVRVLHSSQDTLSILLD